MTPSSILARGETTEATWFDEIDEALTQYARAIQRVAEPGLGEIEVTVRYSCVRWWAAELRKHGVTICGGIGHA